MSIGKNLVMGKNCLRELLQHTPERIELVYTVKISENNKNKTLIEECISRGIFVKFVSREILFSLVNSDSHQLFVAKVKEKPLKDFKKFTTTLGERSLVLALDSIYDPQNLGAIFRAAECFGVDALMWSKNRGVGITPVVSKASAGASEFVEILKVSNLVEAIKNFKKKDYWVVTAEVDERAQNLYSFSFPEKTLLVLGSEAMGVRELVSRNSDYKVFIPMMGKISSLNVSQAASTFLSWWGSQRFFPSLSS